MENIVQPMPTESVAAPTEQSLDLATVKTMLDLPATATDIELITTLVNLVANLQEKYEGLLADAVAMENNVANRDLADFADLIDEENAAFWKEQILTNRNLAIQSLNSIREKMAAQVAAPAPTIAPEPDTRTIPLRNRLAAIDRGIDDVSREVVIARDIDASAMKIRNRAHEIVKNERVPFIIAFARAEKEINKESV